MRDDGAPVGPLDRQAHRGGVFGAEVEDLPDLDPARLLEARAGGGFERGVALLVGRGIVGVQPVDIGLQRRRVVGIDVERARLLPILVVEDAALAGRRDDVELVAEVAADRPGVGAHRDRVHPHRREGPQVGDEHPVVAVPRRGEIDVEAVGILHQELAPAHDAEARADLVAELPLDLIEDARQVAVAPHAVGEDGGEQLLGGR